MTFRDGDTFYPHHPDTVPAGDYAVNNRPGDSWYLVVDEMNQDIAWYILNQIVQDTSWHIHPAIIEYIAQFIINEIRSNYEMDYIDFNYDSCPVVTNFDVSTVIDDNSKLKPMDLDTEFTIVQLTSSFTLTEQLVTNFAITRVYDSTRTPL